MGGQEGGRGFLEHCVLWDGISRLVWKRSSVIGVGRFVCGCFRPSNS